MSDSDYIPAGERVNQYRSPSTHGAAIQAHARCLTSHAVADSVMRELAEALREAKGDIHWVSRAAKALARFDALGGNDA